jgi:hypothetical protein
MRSQTQQLVAMHTRWRDSGLGSDRAHAPVRGAVRRVWCAESSESVAPIARRRSRHGPGLVSKQSIGKK